MLTDKDRAELRNFGKGITDQLERIANAMAAQTQMLATVYNLQADVADQKRGDPELPYD